MKKIKLSLLAITALTFAFVGCKEDTVTPVTPTKNIVQIAQGDTTFSILVQAITKANLGAALSGAGPLTVFAPTNNAFRGLLAELELTSLNDVDSTLLANVLKYHVVSGKVLAASLTDEQVVQPLLVGKTFKIDLTGGAKIVDGRDRVANITATDIQATNGVVHVINKVILPAL